MLQLARWLTLIEQYDYEVVHRSGKKHGNADGLSRRPEATESDLNSEPNNAPCDRVNKIDLRIRLITEAVEPSLVRENLPELQRADPELGRIIQLRLTCTDRPTIAELHEDSEITKKLAKSWEYWEVLNNLVYRRFVNKRSGEPDSLQLLVPRSCVAEVLRHCHAGTVSGHFGVKRTLGQVQRRFYLATWKGDTERYCRRCEQCITYQRGKLGRQGPLKPVLVGTPFGR